MWFLRHNSRSVAEKIVQQLPGENPSALSAEKSAAESEYPENYLSEHGIFKVYLHYILEILFAAVCMVAFLGISATLNLLFDYVLQKGWFQLKFVRYILMGVEYFLILSGVLVFFQMCVRSTWIFLSRLGQFARTFKKAESETTAGKGQAN